MPTTFYDSIEFTTLNGNQSSPVPKLSIGSRLHHAGPLFLIGSSPLSLHFSWIFTCNRLTLASCSSLSSPRSRWLLTDISLRRAFMVLPPPPPAGYHLQSKGAMRPRELRASVSSPGKAVLTGMLMFMFVSLPRSLGRTWLASPSHLASWANRKTLGNKISLCVWLPYRLICFHPSVVLQGTHVHDGYGWAYMCTHMCKACEHLFKFTHTHTYSGNDVELCPTYLTSLSSSLFLDHNSSFGKRCKRSCSLADWCQRTCSHHHSLQIHYIFV